MGCAWWESTFASHSSLPAHQMLIHFQTSVVMSCWHLQYQHAYDDLASSAERAVSAKQVDISKDGRALQKLRREAERAKRALSSQHQVRVEVESLAEGVDLSEPLTRARFEELNNDLFKKTLGPVRRVCCQPVVHCLCRLSVSAVSSLLMQCLVY